MSLLLSSSPWTNDDTSKKRTSTMRKTIKSKPAVMDSADDVYTNTVSDVNIYSSTEKEYRNMQPPTIEETQQSMQERNNRVNDLLQRITTVESATDTKMGAFTPIGNPEINVKKDAGDNTQNIDYILPKITYPARDDPRRVGNYMANDMGNTPGHSNYKMSYEKPALFSKPVQQPAQVGVHDNQLLEKINYMIHLLEEEQLEKTNHITEEFILYTFLGVFIIFIVDGFSRSGKYVR